MTTITTTDKQQRQLNRRDVLLGAIAFVGGAAGLVACGRDATQDLDLHSGGSTYFDADRMRLLGRVVDIAIPATDTPGALAAGVDVFIDRLMADWASAPTQQYYAAILQGIDDAATSAHGRRFVDCSADEQFAVLRAIDADAFGPEPSVPGFRDLKFLVFAGYYTSEIGATVELQFELVPGRYIPCAPIDEIGRAWAFSR